MVANSNQASAPIFDSFELARLSRSMEGEVAVAKLPRLSELVAAPDGTLRYRIQGLVDDEDHPGAEMHLSGTLQLICQRCNVALAFELAQSTRFRWVASEHELNALPVEALDNDEVDAVVGSRAMNLHDWIEDEAILSLPLAPRHSDCVGPPRPETEAKSGAQAEAQAAAHPNPFALLAAQKILNGGK